LVRANCHLSGLAGPAGSARNCRNNLDAVAYLYGSYISTNKNNFAGNLMANDLWWGKARVTVIKNLGVGAARGAGVNAELYFVSSSFWFWDLFNF
jgi:hypothetical protein